MIDIRAIRDGLNELQFQDGQRQVSIGRLSDHVELEQPEIEETEEELSLAWQDSPEASEFLQRVEHQLREHDLLLARDANDPDVLYAVQPLRRSSKVDLSWVAEGINWATRITSIAVLMIGPGLLGLWLDHRLGTWFIAIVGFLVGISGALWYLTVMARR